MKEMNKSLMPAFMGFWLGYLVTSVLLSGWAMLGLYLYGFLSRPGLPYDMTGFWLALLPLLMAGGLTRKFRPGLRAGGLWVAAALDALVLLGFVLLGGDADWFTIPGEVLAAWVPPLAEFLGVGPYYARMMLKDGAGVLLSPLAFTLGCLLARRPEEPDDQSGDGKEGAEWR